MGFNFVDLEFSFIQVDAICLLSAPCRKNLKASSLFLTGVSGTPLINTPPSGRSISLKHISKNDVLPKDYIQSSINFNKQANTDNKLSLSQEDCQLTSVKNICV